MKETIRVNYLNRCPGNFWSIEELFKNIASSLPSTVRYTFMSAPRSGAKLRAILHNILWARSSSNCDVVHVTGDIHYAVLGIRRTPVVLTVHDLRFMEKEAGVRRFLLWLLWLYLPVKCAAHVTVISEFTKTCLLSSVRVNAKKVDVIPDCVGSEFVPTPKENLSSPPVILHVGTTENKNLERLAAACSGIDAEVWILGRLSAAQNDCLARHRIQFREHVGLARSEVVRLYQRCDMVSFVSLYEGFGLPILEAQAVGRPVLTSNIPPMCDVSGAGAYHVDPNSIDEIRSGIAALLGDKQLRCDLVAKGFRNVQNYTADAVAARYHELYRRIVVRSV